jgi:hypothetical protein
VEHQGLKPDEPLELSPSEAASQLNAVLALPGGTPVGAREWHHDAIGR